MILIYFFKVSLNAQLCPRTSVFTLRVEYGLRLGGGWGRGAKPSSSMHSASVEVDTLPSPLPSPRGAASERQLHWARNELQTKERRGAGGGQTKRTHTESSRDRKTKIESKNKSNEIELGFERYGRRSTAGRLGLGVLSEGNQSKGAE